MRINLMSPLPPYNNANGPHAKVTQGESSTARIVVSHCGMTSEVGWGLPVALNRAQLSSVILQYLYDSIHRPKYMQITDCIIDICKLCCIPDVRDPLQTLFHLQFFC